MSDRAYFADTFRNLGNMTVNLNDALNLLVRSYRVKIPNNEVEEARDRMLSFLTILLDVEEEGQSLWLQQLREALKSTIVRKGGLAKLDLIRKELKSKVKLSKPEVDFLDSLISQASHQATIAFRKFLLK